MKTHWDANEAYNNFRLTFCTSFKNLGQSLKKQYEKNNNIIFPKTS